MQLLAFFTSIFLAASAVLAAPAADNTAGMCAVCLDTALDGASLVASSGGTMGVPRFCG